MDLSGTPALRSPAAQQETPTWEKRTELLSTHLPASCECAGRAWGAPDGPRLSRLPQQEPLGAEVAWSDAHEHRGW